MRKRSVRPALFAVVAAVLLAAGCDIAWTVQPLSVDDTGRRMVDPRSGWTDISADGTTVAFTSRSATVAPGEVEASDDVFVRDLTTGSTTVVSGGPYPGGSYDAALSADGKRVAFVTNAPYDPADVEVFPDIYVRDRVSGNITSVTGHHPDSLPPALAISYAQEPDISPDGTKVVYLWGSGLPWPTPGSAEQVYMTDLATGATTLLSASATTGGPSEVGSGAPQFSPDGSAVFFESRATDIVTPSTTGGQHVYRYDLATGERTLVDRRPDGIAADGSAWINVVSPDGRRVAFTSAADNLGTGAPDDVRDLFVRDLVTGTVTRVSADAEGRTGGDEYTQYSAAFDPTGTRLAFNTPAGLVAGDDNGLDDVYVRDLTTGDVTFVSATASGAGGNGRSGVSPGAFSDDGQLVAFGSAATDLAKGIVDANDAYDVLVRDLRTGKTSLVSKAATGNSTASHRSGPASFVPGGRRLVFFTWARNLEASDPMGSGLVYLATPA